MMIMVNSVLLSRRVSRTSFRKMLLILLRLIPFNQGKEDIDKRLFTGLQFQSLQSVAIENFAIVDDCYAIAEYFCFGHVMSGKQNALSILFGGTDEIENGFAADDI